MSEVELLNQSFAELVQRHLPWVYGVARRRLRDAHLAEDAAQAVFVLLHRKAPKFPSEPAMVSWLHKTAWYVTEVAVRNERRRRHHENEAGVLKSQVSKSGDEADWAELAPLLDELIGRLKREDREAILLRYYRDMTFAEVGREMKTSEDAANKRVTRAVEKLRQMAEKKGVALSLACLTMNLETHLRIPPPVGLTASATGAALSPAGSSIAAPSAPLVKGALSMMALKTKLIAACAAASMMIGGIVLVAAPTAPAPHAAGDNPPAALAKEEYPRLAPYAAIRWRYEIPEVQIDGTWYELQAINDVEAAKIVAFAKNMDQDLWQKRFDEDLVEVMSKMGNPPGAAVSLKLVNLETKKTVTLDDVPMTKENRQAIWRARHPQQ